MKHVGTGTLFEKFAKTAFLEITGSRFSAMVVRVKKKGFPGVPFDKDGFRAHILAAIGGGYDGFVRCRYCSGFFTIADVGIDHAIPLSRGGGVELSNLDLPCKSCNNRKGSMTPTEFILLTQFLDSVIPLAKQDVFQRLGMSNSLAAGARSNAATIKELQGTGEWQKVKTAQRLAKKS
jgi:hypothetical protein